MTLRELLKQLREAQQLLGPDAHVHYRPAVNFVATTTIAKAKMVGDCVVLCEDPNS